MAPRQPTEVDVMSRAFAAEIRAERTAKRMTQKELAKLSRLGESTIKRIENEERMADTDQLWKICQALGLTVTDLSERAERRLRSEAQQPRKRVSGG